MSQNVTLSTTVYTIPERDEVDWAEQVTSFLVNTGNILDGVGLLIGSEGVMKCSSTTSTLAAAATLTATHTRHIVDGSSGAVTLNTTTPVAAGTADGQILILEGTDNTNTVTIQTGGNVDLVSDVTLTDTDVITLKWNSTDSKWKEVSRSKVHHLTNQQSIRFFEQRANGSNYVELQAAASLSGSPTLVLNVSALPAVDLPLMLDTSGNIAVSSVNFKINDLTLPSPGPEFLLIDQNGDLTTSTGSGGQTLDAAYDFGGAGGGRTITADAGAVQIVSAANSLLDLDHNHTGSSIAIDIDKTAGTGNVVDINKSATGTGSCINVNNAGTGRGLSIQQTGDGVGFNVTKSSGTQNCAEIAQVGTGAALLITTGTANAVAVNLDHNATGAAIAVDIDKTAGSGNVIDINNAGTGDAFAITASAGIGVDIDHNTTGSEITIDIDKTAGSGNVLDILNGGTGDAVQIVQSGNGISVDLDDNSTSSNITIDIDKTAGSGNVLDIANGGTGDAVQIVQSGNGISIDLNDNSTSSAVTIDIDKTSTDASGVVIDVNNSGTGIGQVITQAAGSNSDVGLHIAIPSDSDTGHLKLSGLTTLPASATAGTLHYNETTERLEFELNLGTIDDTHAAAVPWGFAFGIKDDRTESANAVTVRSGWTQVTGSNDPGADTLDTINTTPAAQIGDVILITSKATTTLTVKGDGSGNIYLENSADRVLSSARDSILLMFSGSEWWEVGKEIG